MYLHITNHCGTKQNMENVFHYLDKDDLLVTQPIHYPIYIDRAEADDFFTTSQISEKYHTLIFSDIIMNARPFLQNIDKHNFNIIIYITNRFHWGIWENIDPEYFELYSAVSNSDRVTFISDNRYDQYLAGICNIRFKFDDILRLTPIICDQVPHKHNSKLVIYNRGTYITKYEHTLQKISYDIFGENHTRYRDQDHLTEYLGYLHLPYQTNIQSLWENLGYGIIYFIPSKRFIRNLIIYSDWYYWEEKSKPMVLLLRSIELSEWYQPENEVYFVYFDSWEHLYQKYSEYALNNEMFISKRESIMRSIRENNIISLDSWKKIIH